MSSVLGAALRPVDAVEVTVLVDNSVDILLPSSCVAVRPPTGDDWPERLGLRAEHGLSLLVTTFADGRASSVLYDAGLRPGTAMHNMDLLQIRPRDLRAIVISHGHADHHGGLAGLARRVGRRGLPLLLHPDAWRERRTVLPSGEQWREPPPSARDLAAEGVEVVEERGPSLLLDGHLLVSGQIDRVSDFEKGLPWQQALLDGRWEPDPWVWDDQSIVVEVAGRGLVVLSACSHAGVVNVIEDARRVTGVPRLHALVGGLHLSGQGIEPVIAATIERLVAYRPDHVVPGHCTGWWATHELARALPDAYVQTSVGTTLRFGRPGG